MKAKELKSVLERAYCNGLFETAKIVCENGQLEITAIDPGHVVMCHAIVKNTGLRDFATVWDLAQLMKALELGQILNENDEVGIEYESETEESKLAKIALTTSSLKCELNGGFDLPGNTPLFKYEDGEVKGSKGVLSKKVGVLPWSELNKMVSVMKTMTSVSKNNRAKISFTKGSPEFVLSNKSDISAIEAKFLLLDEARFTAKSVLNDEILLDVLQTIAKHHKGEIEICTHEEKKGIFVVIASDGQSAFEYYFAEVVDE